MFTAEVWKAGICRAGVVVIAILHRRVADAPTAYGRGCAGIVVIAVATGRLIDAPREVTATIGGAVIVIIASRRESAFAGALLTIVPKCAGVAVFAVLRVGALRPGGRRLIGVATFTFVVTVERTVVHANVVNQAEAWDDGIQAAPVAVALVLRTFSAIITGVGCPQTQIVHASITVSALVVVVTRQSNHAGGRLPGIRLRVGVSGVGVGIC